MTSGCRPAAARRLSLFGGGPTTPWPLKTPQHEPHNTHHLIKGVGVVTKVGPGVTGLAPGQRVTARPWGARNSDGSWQSVCTLPAKQLVPVPDSVSDEAAAQFYVSGGGQGEG